jgi:hypothetical protein
MITRSYARKHSPGQRMLTLKFVAHFFFAYGIILEIFSSSAFILYNREIRLGSQCMPCIQYNLGNPTYTDQGAAGLP